MEEKLAAHNVIDVVCFMELVQKERSELALELVKLKFLNRPGECEHCGEVPKCDSRDKWACACRTIRHSIFKDSVLECGMWKVEEWSVCLSAALSV